MLLLFLWRIAHYSLS